MLHRRQSIEIRIDITIEDGEDTHNFDSVREAKEWMEEEKEAAEARVNALESAIDDLEG